MVAKRTTIWHWYRTLALWKSRILVFAFFRAKTRLSWAFCLHGTWHLRVLKFPERKVEISPFIKNVTLSLSFLSKKTCLWHTFQLTRHLLWLLPNSLKMVVFHLQLWLPSSFHFTWTSSSKPWRVTFPWNSKYWPIKGHMITAESSCLSLNWSSDGQLRWWQANTTNPESTQSYSSQRVVVVHQYTQADQCVCHIT